MDKARAPHGETIEATPGGLRRMPWRLVTWDPGPPERTLIVELIFRRTPLDEVKAYVTRFIENHDPPFDRPWNDVTVFRCVKDEASPGLPEVHVKVYR